MRPRPAIAASMAASAVLTIRRELDGDRRVDLAERETSSSRGDIRPSNVTQSCLVRYAGSSVRRVKARYLEPPQTTRRIDSNLARHRLLSGSSPIRSATSTCSSSQVDHAIGEQHASVDVRIDLKEVRNNRQNVQSAEHDRCGDQQVALGRAVLSRCRALGLPDFLQDCPTASRHIGPPGVRRRSRQLDRTSRRFFRCASSSSTLRLTVASGEPSFLDAADRLPASTAASSTDIASRRSTRTSQ